MANAGRGGQCTCRVLRAARAEAVTRLPPLPTLPAIKSLLAAPLLLAAADGISDLDVLTAPVLVTLEGERAQFQVQNQKAYVAGFEVQTEADGSQVVADPVVATFLSGVSVDLRAHRDRQGRWGGAIAVTETELEDMREFEALLGEAEVTSSATRTSVNPARDSRRSRCDHQPRVPAGIPVRSDSSRRDKPSRSRRPNNPRKMPLPEQLRCSCMESLAATGKPEEARAELEEAQRILENDPDPAPGLLQDVAEALAGLPKM